MDQREAFDQVEHEHHFPLPADPMAPDMEPGDCLCGMSYQQYDSELGERIAHALEEDD